MHYCSIYIQLRMQGNRRRKFVKSLLSFEKKAICPPIKFLEKYLTSLVYLLRKFPRCTEMKNLSAEVFCLITAWWIAFFVLKRNILMNLKKSVSICFVIFLYFYPNALKENCIVSFVTFLYFYLPRRIVLAQHLFKICHYFYHPSSD